MRRLDQVLAVVAEWVQKAENDLTTAAHTLKLRAKCPTDTVCFHAQQCVEKYLKALLVLNGVSFPKTHDIEDILALVPAPCRPDLSIDDQARLTNYATVACYPGGQPPIALAEARCAVSTARRVRRDVRRLLPRQALRRPL